MNHPLPATMKSIMLLLLATTAACTLDVPDEGRLGSAEQAIVGPDYVAVLATESSGLALVQYDDVSTATRKRAIQGEPFDLWMRFDYMTEDGPRTQYELLPLASTALLGQNGAEGTSTVAATVVAEAKPLAGGTLESWAQIIGPDLPPPGNLGPEQP